MLDGPTFDALVASGIEDVPASDDPLAEALHHLRMDGMFYCRSELTAPWGLDLPPLPDCLWFHVVTKGTCVIIDSDDRAWELGAGDVIVLPHGAGHRAFDTSTTPGTTRGTTSGTTPCPVVFDLPHRYISRHYAVLHHGGDETDGESATIICGVARLGHPAAQLLLSMLPEIIHVDGAAQRERWEWLPSLLTLMAAEARSARPGGETIITRLSDILVIQAIRSWIDDDPAAHTGWIRALRDPSIGRAIIQIHRDPGRAWTVGSLAAAVATSRSSFSARFTELVGQSPKQYLTSWRMRLAVDLLRDSSRTVADVGTELGYQSEAAFSRAFTREVGIAPSRARRPVDVVDLAQSWSHAH